MNISGLLVGKHNQKVYIVLLILILLLTATACSKKKTPVNEAQESKAQAVSVVKVEKSDLVNLVTISGKLIPHEEVKVVPKSSGKVVGAYGEVGQSVVAGQVLLELDSSTAKANLESSRAAVPVAEANLQKARETLEKSRLQLVDAQRTLERQKALLNEKAIAQADYDQAQTNYDALQKECAINEANLNSAQANLEQSRASLLPLDVELGNAVVRAPISGVIAEKNINVGEYASSSSPSFVLVNIDSVDVKADLTETDIGGLKTGQSINVKVSAVAQKPYVGRITKISPVADDENKTFPIWISVDNPQKTLKPGMFADIELKTNQKQGVLTVPTRAIVERSGNKLVFVADGYKAVERKIKTGISDGQTTEILDGLKEGESVIDKGLSDLSDGAAITLKSNAAQSPEQGAGSTQR